MDPRYIYNFTIRDNNGVVYATITVDPMADDSSHPFAGSMINFAYSEGVSKVVFKNDYYYENGHELSGYVGGVPAHVYFMDTEGDGVGINLSGINSEVKVYSWRETGEMAEIITPANGCGEDNYCSSIPSGYGKVIIAVTGDITSLNGYYVNFSRWNW